MKKQTKKTVQPLGDRVLIKEMTESSSETKTKSGIIIPVSAHEDKGAKRGTVIAVGPGRYDDGELIPVAVNVGDNVLFTWGEKLKIDSEEYSIMREGEIIAVIK